MITVLTTTSHHLARNVVMILALSLLALGLNSCAGLNGKDLTPAVGPKGLCQLTIHNNYDQDVAVKLYDVKNPTVCLRYVYISSNSSATIKELAPGNLTMKYTRGSDWDNAGMMFQHDRVNYESDEVLKLEEIETQTKTSDGVRTERKYSVLEFTFNAQGNKGNTTVSPIDDKEFQTK